MIPLLSLFLYESFCELRGEKIVENAEKQMKVQYDGTRKIVARIGVLGNVWYHTMRSEIVAI